MHGGIDEGRLRELLVESDDLQSDAIKGANAGLADCVEAAQEAPSDRQRSGAGPLAGVAALAEAATLMSASAASLENLAVTTYETALTLPFIGGDEANAVVKAFTMKTMSQHAEAFNTVTQRVSGRPQTGVPRKYQSVVDAALPGIKGSADVVGLAITLENVDAQTYVKDVGSRGATRHVRAELVHREAAEPARRSSRRPCIGDPDVGRGAPTTVSTKSELFILNGE